MAVMGSADVLVARIVSGRVARDSRANRSFLSCRSSGAASTIRSASAASASRSEATASRIRDALHGALRGAGRHVEEHRLVAGPRSHLGDAASHRPGADHQDALDVDRHQTFPK